MLAGCASSGGLVGGRGGTASGALAADGQRRASGRGDSVSIYLQTLRDLIEGDAVVRSRCVPQRGQCGGCIADDDEPIESCARARDPGHPSSNALEAQSSSAPCSHRATRCSRGTDARARSLERSEQRLILDAEAQRCSARPGGYRSTQRSERAASQAALDENRQLKAELEEARQSSMPLPTSSAQSERENGTNPR